MHAKACHTSLLTHSPCFHSHRCALQLSAVAFSTAYQLVQWFRHADIIGLGMGGVGTGPMVLLLQLGLAAGPLPQRWQWIAMFEITAGTWHAIQKQV